MGYGFLDFYGVGSIALRKLTCSLDTQFFFITRMQSQDCSLVPLKGLQLLGLLQFCACECRCDVEDDQRFVSYGLAYNSS